MAERLHRVLNVQIREEDGFPVKLLASLAGCSTSLFYEWSTVDGMKGAKAHYLWALAARLAEEYQNYRLIQILLPVGVRLAHADDLPTPNGCCDDEHVEGGLALAQAVLGHRGKDPEAIEMSAAQLRDVAKRLDLEAAVLRQSSEG